MDIVIIAAVVCFLVLMAYNGFKQGFVKIVTSMLALVAALFLTCVLVAPASAVIKSSTPIYDKIEESVEKAFSNENIKDAADISKLNIPDKLKDIILKTETAENLKSETVKTVSDMVFAAVIYVTTFVIAYIVVIIITKALDIVSKLPGINSMNHIAGLIVGILHGVGYLWVACVVIAMCGHMEWAMYITGVINGNPLLSFIYEYNPLMMLLTFLL